MLESLRTRLTGYSVNYVPEEDNPQGTLMESKDLTLSRRCYMEIVPSLLSLTVPRLPIRIKKNCIIWHLLFYSYSYQTILDCYVTRYIVS